MKSAVITFPGSNRERDMMHALKLATGIDPLSVWHAETSLPDVDLVVLPGGFSYGDYLRSGAIAARAPIMDAVRDFAASGRLVLGVCNGFQMLTEAGLLPGALMRNKGLTFVCREVLLETASTASPFTRHLEKGNVWRCRRPSRWKLLRRRRNARSPRGGRPGRVPLCGWHQSERLRPRHCRHHQ